MSPAMKRTNSITASIPVALRETLDYLQETFGTKPSFIVTRAMQNYFRDHGTEYGLVDGRPVRTLPIDPVQPMQPQSVVETAPVLPAATQDVHPAIGENPAPEGEEYTPY